MIHSFKGIKPRIHPSVFLAHGAEIIGDVEIGADSSVWFNTVIRGDVNYVRIGERTNVQDGCVLHVQHETYPLVIGSEVTIGHGVILHACTIRDRCLIGMGAIVLDNADIKPYTLIAAGSLVRMHSAFPEGVMVVGVPAKVIRKLTDEERAMIDELARNYVEYARAYRNPITTTT